MLRALRPEIVDELNGASSAQQEVLQARRNKSEARTILTPMAFSTKRAFPRLFKLLNVLIY